MIDKHPRNTSPLLVTIHCLPRTLFDVIKSDVITLVTVHLKNSFYVLKSISDWMILWNLNLLWGHLCVLFNFIHYLLNDPCIWFRMWNASFYRWHSVISATFEHLKIMNGVLVSLMNSSLMNSVNISFSKNEWFA